MGLWYYGREFTQIDPTFPKYVLSSVQWIHPFLSRLFRKNKLLASVPCFQKICLLFTNDLCFLTIACRPSRSFFLFPFCFIFIFTKSYTHGPLRGKPFLYTYILIHDKLFLYTHWNSFSLRHSVYIQDPIYVQRFFSFFPTHTYGSYKSFFIHIRCSHIQEFLSTHHLHTQKPSIHISLLKHFSFSLYT